MLSTLRESKSRDVALVGAAVVVGGTTLVVSSAVLKFLWRFGTGWVSSWWSYGHIREEGDLSGILGLSDTNLFMGDGIEKFWRNYLEMRTKRGSSPRIFYGGWSPLLMAPLVMVVSPEANERVLRDVKDFPTPDSFNESFEPLIGQSLVTSEGKLWKRQRKLLTPLFHFSNLKDNALPASVRCSERIMVREIVKAQELKKNGDAKGLKNLQSGATEVFSLLSLGVLVETTFGGDVDVEKMRDLWGGATRSLNYWTILRMMLGSLVDWWPFWPCRDALAACKKLRGTVQELINTRRADLKNGQQRGTEDLITLMLLARDPETGEEMGDSLIIDEALLMLVASQQTTSSLLAWATYFLCKHPEVQERLRDELMSQLEALSPEAKESSVSQGELKGIETAALRSPLLTAVLKETLRLASPAPFIVRETRTEQDLDGLKVPKGAMVLPFFHGTHTSPEAWGENSYEFDPERFIIHRETEEAEAKGGERETEETGSETKAGSEVETEGGDTRKAAASGKGTSYQPRHAYAFTPFSAGPRNCIGMRLAMQVAQVALATLVLTFDISSPPEVDLSKVTMRVDDTLKPSKEFVPVFERRI
uniref:Cytochrome P450 n=1 Tax=Chromera velia CCMP2878 TaxID=1169474 RepID=A0A0G4IEQ0_9ALVE|mmetsp:Transcript_45390/g.89411  ORF Transcript_45390/g.89411 Transcript_45390/m.89411 type:complete len:592 (+) Transcript_45390:110-1885(+)|eukprot:Cvel_13782.t1-p1 / transcript=Cvel_13782.t1 / gene=Cvel_13782 / organism=Chromera_velia_CCMP2878 / gene_product=Probable cytochrome P450 4s3, putative / transcript_product=Probable cytochrome P450 4s3, putative / location=Cvel_scaffold955:12672-16482(-) / protein_length=591 / sequence_SO=supercontig / SO=protein_coding / is_pseudo=false